MTEDSGVDLEELSTIGFGSYRVDVRDSRNWLALEEALAAGCNLIDTASNYSDGRSEELVGAVLEETHARAFVMTKVGYISPTTARQLAQGGVAVGELPHIAGGAFYSLEPGVVRAVLDLSRSRLRRSVLDAVLLHNPEHLLATGADDDAGSEAIRTALLVLQEEVDAGRLRYYGVSSNAMPTALPTSCCDFEALMAASPAREPSDGPRLMEFPLNLVERAAATADGRPPLLSRTAGQVRTFTNRPLNAMVGDDVARLANSVQEVDDSTWDECVAIVQGRLATIDAEHAWADFGPMRFLRDNRDGIHDPDQIDAVWRSRVAPFLRALYDGEPPGEVLVAFADLRDAMGSRRRGQIEERGKEAARSRPEVEGFGSPAGGSLARSAVRYCLNAGADHVLVGMRRPEYVRELAPLFGSRPALASAGP